jgi:hypothetical protein
MGVQSYNQAEPNGIDEILDACINITLKKNSNILDKDQDIVHTMYHQKKAE